MMFSKAFRDIEKGRAKIEKLNRKLAIHNQQLDLLVEEKTRDIRSILTNIPQGICLLKGEEIEVSQEFSAYMNEIVETEKIAGSNFIDMVFEKSNVSKDDQSQMFTTLLSGIGEDLFAFEVNSHLLVHEFRTIKDGQQQIFEIDWSPIVNNEDQIEKYLVSIRNVTKIRALLAEAEQRQEELKIISEIINVPQEKFENFVVSSQEFLAEKNEQLLLVPPEHRSDSVRRLFRNMHTIKGNARAHNLTEVSNLAHDAEAFIRLYETMFHYGIKSDSTLNYSRLLSVSRTTLILTLISQTPAWTRRSDHLRSRRA